ncbi:FtsX-like permease family protein [Lachnospiraceae bacterium ZAX-1]
MVPTLKKISIRKVMREKGKSSCIVLALFLTTVMFIMIFSTFFFMKDALDEIARTSAAWSGHAAFIVTDEEEKAIENSDLVSETTSGLHVGEILDSGGYMTIELVSYEEEMAYWMKCYPTEGRMPKKGDEIVVSRRYLEDHGLEFKENEAIDVAYSVDGTKYTDSFTLVGTYDRDINSKHVMLLSKEFHDEVGRRLEEQGKDSRDILYKLVEVIYRSSAHITDTTYQLMDEIGFDEENEPTINDRFSDAGGFSTGVIAILVIFILFVMMVGYLFISNIFSISIHQDAKFYGKLATNGVLDSEIKKMLLLENNILFLSAIIPAFAIGYLFTSLTLPGILKSFFAFQVRDKGNPWIFILAALFSYLTLMASARKPINLAKKISPMGMKQYMHKFKPVSTCEDRNCLNRFIMRKFWNDKKNAWKIYLSIAFSVLLANLFYAAVMGFNEEEYIGSSMPTDYIVANTTMYTEEDPRERKAISLGELTACMKLPGLIQSGGGGVCDIRVTMNDTQAKEYDKIVGDDNLNNPKAGDMMTQAYGLDDIMVEKMIVLDGEVDLEAYRTGEYVIVDPLGDDGATCLHVGDRITLPFQNGNSKMYSVMAIAELPYEISFQNRWTGSSNLFLPYLEWSSQSGMYDYYMYTYDVEEEYKKSWDDTLSSVVSDNPALTYQSAKTLAEESKGQINEIKMVGFVLSAILLCMGIVNFINCMANSVYSRRRALAIMQSMGTTKSEIIRVLIKEGMLYMAGGTILGCVISIPCTYLVVEKELIFYSIHYRFYPAIYLLFAFIGIAAAVLVPCIAYLHMDKKEPFLSRIRACRE